MIAKREAQRGDAGVGKSGACGDDVRLVWIATESMEHDATAYGRRLREMEDAFELPGRDREGHGLDGHASGAGAFAGVSGIARSSKTFWRSSISARVLMSSSTFLRPFIFPTRIAPTSFFPRKKSRL